MATLRLIAESFEVKKKKNVILLTGKNKISSIRIEVGQKVGKDAGGCGSTFTLSNLSLPSDDMPCGALHFPTKIKLTEYLLFHSLFPFRVQTVITGGKKKWKIITAVADVYNSDN